MSIQERMKKTIERLNEQLGGIRTGRANPDLLKNIIVDYYGTTTPLKQVASISVSEIRTLSLQVFDANAIKDVEKAILQSPLALTPRTEGSVIRIQLPELTEERRKELVKVAKKHAEEARVSIRNIRRDEIEKIKKNEKEKEITEDESKSKQSDIQKQTDTFIAEIESIIITKEKDILTV
jgi:ribosome recycling factor